MGDIRLKLEQLHSIILSKSDESVNGLKELHHVVKQSPPHIIENLTPVILSILSHIIVKPDDFKNNVKVETIRVLMEIFNKIKIDRVGLYFNISTFLIGELCHLPNCTIKDVYEEYKLLIINCLISLNNCVSMNILLDIYKRKYNSIFMPIIYTCINFAKSEKLRSLRIAAIDCIMTITRVGRDLYDSDIVLCHQIAETFMLFLPGLTSGLCKICLEDEKIGHKVTKIAIRAWAGLVNLFAKNNPSEKRTNFDMVLLLDKPKLKPSTKRPKKWSNEAEFKEYFENSSRTSEWYDETDLNLYEMVDLLQGLCNHSHSTVRLEFAKGSLLLLENCTDTLPKCISRIVVILITLSEDNDPLVSEKCKLGLEHLSSKFSSNYFLQLLNYLEEDFYRMLKLVPNIFNGLDNQKQQSSLNCLIGYIRLFGKYELISILHSTTGLLVESLLYICELDKIDVRLLEEWTVKDFDENPDLRTPWKKFMHFASDDLASKLVQLCELLAQDIVVDIVSDCLLNIYRDDVDRRKEATILLNEILSVKISKGNIEIVKTVIDLYLEPQNWNIPISTSTDDENNINLTQVQNNVVQICLQLEGIGKIALILQNDFKEFLLKTLYPVLEKAGSGQPLLKAAGLAAIVNISVACKYHSVTDLINNNSDYFSYHVTRKMKDLNRNQHVLNVLGVVMNHCSMDVLPSINDIVEDVLFQSRYCTSGNMASFMKVFNIFTNCLLRWLNIKIELPPIKSKAEKEQELKHFEVSNLEEEYTNFGDDIMGKTAEEMYEEDMKKKEEEELENNNVSEVEECKKPEPPQHIKLVVLILQRTLHFLPLKNKEVKLLSLEILQNGLEVIRDWEDELLPIVHQIWSPLVNRFKEDNDSLIFNLSFQLLMTLGRLSKEFIRLRTVKEVLPSILNNLKKLSNESYLKDKGSAYRYTQAYKLQITILQHFPRLIIYLEMAQEHIRSSIEVVAIYLSDKQPLPLRTLSIEFFKTLAIYDIDTVKSTLENLETTIETEKNTQYLLDVL
ncbi:hypothetical protein Trydic_g6398 [Trypoxylus dichotomus]